MDDKRKCFTFIWKIKNFSLSFNYTNYFDSPHFSVHAICGSEWNLVLNVNSNVFKDFIVCRLWNVSAPPKLEFDYELSFLGSDGSVLLTEKFFKKIFVSNFDGDSSLKAKRDDVFELKKHLFIPDDTLTIRCRMWKTQESISVSAKCLVETRINTECISFIGTIDKFASCGTNGRNRVYVKSPEEKFPVSYIYLRRNVDGKLHIQINPVDIEPSYMYKIKVFITDVYGNKVKSCHEDIFDIPPFSIPLIFSMEHLTENKELYLPNDELTLHFKVIFPKYHKIDNILEEIADKVYIYDCEDAEAPKANMKDKDYKYSSEEYPSKSSTTLADDLISLLSEGILYDTKLKTATETFPAHTVVLSARSPVFKSMFVTDMREKIKGCVEIEDLDADTVRQMLSFMYKDTLDKMDYESAKSLYFAADKYNIVSLRLQCSNFLKQNLLDSNCCDILLFADKYQDLELKKGAQDCIEKNDEAVFSSKEWKNMEKNYPQLTVEILRNLYMKNKKA